MVDDEGDVVWREEYVTMRGSGIDPSIPGRPTQPWEFDFSFGGRRSRSASSSAPSTSTSGVIPEDNKSQRLGRNSGNFSGFTFLKPNPTKSHVVDAVTINDGSSEANKPLQLKEISISKAINKTSNKRPTAYMKSAKALGRSIIDPILQTCRLEERDRYKLLVRNSKFRKLNFSKVSPDEMNATPPDFGSSPTVSFRRRSSVPRKYPTQQISDKIKNDLE